MPKTRNHLTPAEAEAKGLLCCKHLKERHRLMPGLNTRPAGSVWQGQGAYYVYNPAACVPWRWEPGPAQLRRQSVARRAQYLIGGDCLTLDTETTGLGDDADMRTRVVEGRRRPRIAVIWPRNNCINIQILTRQQPVAMSDHQVNQEHA